MGATDLRIKLIGCGGIGGTHLAPNLCQFLHAERRLAHVVLVDGDAFEERNRSRMRFSARDNKAVVLARELADAFGDVLTIEPVPEYVTRDNVRVILAENDVVFVAVDNHATRRLIDDAVGTFSDVTVISGGNDGIEDGQDGTYGNVQFLRRVAGQARTNTLSRLHPEIRNPADRLPSELGCAELAQAGAAQLLFTNLAVASAMLNAFYALLREQVAYEEVYIDIVKNRVVPVQRSVVPSEGSSDETTLPKLAPA